MTDEREKLVAELREYENEAGFSGNGLGYAPCRLFGEAAAYIEAHPAPAPVEYDEAGLRDLLAGALDSVDDCHGAANAVRHGVEDDEDDVLVAALNALRTLATRLAQVTAQRDELCAFVDAAFRTNDPGDPYWRAALSRIKGERP